MSFLIDRCRSRSRLAEELVETWEHDHRDAMAVYDLEEVIRECLELAELIHRAAKTTLDDLFEETIADIDVLRPILIDSIQRSSKVLKKVMVIANLFDSKGYRIDSTAKLARSITDLTDLREEIEASWPTADIEMAAAALAEFHRGDYQDSEELLRESQNHHTKTN